MLFKLEKTLRELDITRNKLAVYSDVRPNTINDLANGDAKRIEIDTLEKILKSLNEISMTRGMPRTYNIEDILEYELTDEFINASKRRSIMTDAEFDKISEILSQDFITTDISGLEFTHVRELIFLFGDYIKDNGIQIGQKINDDHVAEVNETLLNCVEMLKLYGLMKAKTNQTFQLTDKGLEFIQRLRDI
ncbi:helix-turn-helix domain-containing protein [Paenibacillus taichungensis]|uniref:helix-turn-helix domain-containing protein n=1 Tax=Paenibacillus taichungensis TaxID=484184 RepID=UPI0039A2ECEC